MAGGRWANDPARRFGRLKADQRLALFGAVAILLSLPLPWWRSPTDDNLVLTGLGGFSFVEAALVLTAAAVLFLLFETGGGYQPPRPLREWALLVAGGIWAAAIVGYRVVDPPEFTGGAGQAYELHYGIVIALAGAALIVAAGLRRRSDEPPPPDEG